MPFRKAAFFILLLVLIIEVLLVVSYRRLGWDGTNSAAQFATFLLVTSLPLFAAFWIILRKGRTFSIRSLLVATMFVAMFLMLSLIPLRHRYARLATQRLLSVNASINDEGTDWDEFYAQFELSPRPEFALARTSAVSEWVATFTTQTNSIPLDLNVRGIWLYTDAQCQILAENWERFPSLQSVTITPGISNSGFRVLQDVLPRFTHLDSVHTNEVSVPTNWFRSLTNIRTLMVLGDGVASRGTSFSEEDVNDIASLSNLEMFMVSGYAFNDKNARELSRSTSIKRVILRWTAVTKVGESDLEHENRIVYRD